MLFEIHASGEGREFKLPLTTKGHLFIGVRVTQMDKPTYQELGLIHCEPVVKPLVQLKDLPATAKKMQREQSEAHITITPTPPPTPVFTPPFTPLCSRL